MKVTDNTAQAYTAKSKILEDIAIKEEKTAEKATQSTFFDEVKISQSAQVRVVQETLQAEMKKEIQSALEELDLEFESAMDMKWSPESTAQRIFDFATSFFDIWFKQNPELSEGEAVNGFENLVRGATDKGFGEAMGTLSSYSVGDEVLKTANETKEVLDQKFDVFFNQMREDLDRATEQGTIA